MEARQAIHAACDRALVIVPARHCPRHSTAAHDEVEKSQAFLLTPKQERAGCIAVQSAWVWQPGLQALAGLEPWVRVTQTFAPPEELYPQPPEQARLQ